MPYSPTAIANFFIKKAAESPSGASLTPMKLIKLVFLAHGWHLGLTKQPLIDEDVEAWKFGPVIPSLYRAFKTYGSSQVPSSAYAPWEPIDQLRPLYPLLEKVWDMYKDHNGSQLSTLTHKQGTPWDVAWNGNGGRMRNGEPIPNDLIQGYYEAKVNAAKSAAAAKPAA